MSKKLDGYVELKVDTILELCKKVTKEIIEVQQEKNAEFLKWAVPYYFDNFYNKKRWWKFKKIKEWSEDDFKKWYRERSYYEYTDQEVEDFSKVCKDFSGNFEEFYYWWPHCRGDAIKENLFNWIDAVKGLELDKIVQVSVKDLRYMCFYEKENTVK